MPFEGDGNREGSIEVATFEQNLEEWYTVGRMVQSNFYVERTACAKT